MYIYFGMEGAGEREGQGMLGAWQIGGVGVEEHGRERDAGEICRKFCWRRDSNLVRERAVGAGLRWDCSYAR